LAQNSEKTMRLVNFKQKLEKKIEDLETELKEQQTMLETVNQLILEKGFKRPEIPKQEAIREAPSPEEEESLGHETEASIHAEVVEGEQEVTELCAADGELLARAYSDGHSLRVIPVEGKNFYVNVSPFGNFLVERVLTKMQERDAELARMGKLSTASIFSYNITRDGDLIKEISIKNIDRERLKELNSSIRWTLEKMYEKMTSEN
jgi:hypothetical protein